MKCAICGNDKFKSGVDRPFLSCINCGAMERHRALWNIMYCRISDNARVLDIGPLSENIYGGVLKKRKTNIISRFCL